MKKFRLKFMKRKRSLRLTPIPRIRVKIGTNKEGYVHCLFGSYGKRYVPRLYDENGAYIKGQPRSAWISAILHSPEYKPRWNRDLKRTFWNYIRMNIKHIHPSDLAKP